METSGLEHTKDAMMQSTTGQPSFRERPSIHHRSSERLCLPVNARWVAIVFREPDIESILDSNVVEEDADARR